MKILITGGFGYLGSLIASFLVKKPGVTLLLASREKRTVPSWLPNAKALKVIWEDDKNIESICSEVDCIIHAAGLDADLSNSNPAYALKVNGVFTAKLARIASYMGVKRFIYFSTVHVYKAPLHGKISENSRLSNFHPYAFSNLSGEFAVLNEMKQNDKFICNILRLSNIVACPTSPEINCWNLVVPNLCRQVIENSGCLEIRSAPSIKRDYVPGSFLKKVIWSCIKNKTKIPIVNVCSGKSESLKSISHLIMKRANKTLNVGVEIRFNNENKQIKSHNLEIKSLFSEIVDQDDLVQEIDRILLSCKNWFGKYG